MSDGTVVTDVEVFNWNCFYSKVYANHIQFLSSLRINETLVYLENQNRHLEDCMRQLGLDGFMPSQNMNQ